MVETSTPIEIFCSYAHEDEVWLRKLETHLSLLKRQGLISLWHDRLIIPGVDWAQTIDAHLETASVILLLVSANFLASNYCYGVEMKRALERQEADEARVVPILVRPVDWKDAPFAHLQMLPTDAKPLASWRDEHRALADVAASIRRVIEDMPLLAASAPRANLPAIWNIPHQRNPFFLGRDNKLAQLRSLLQAGQATALSQPQAISGLGGIGKTQLALEYAYRYHQDYQVVLWARAESIEALISSYVAIATLLRLPEREAKEQDIIVQAVKTWLQSHRGWLLILDNADELAFLPNFLPPSPEGHLLLTTRATATGRLAQRMEVETLLPEQGALLLLRRAGMIPPDAELSQADLEERLLALQVSQELGGLPLALDQAGAYLEATRMNLTEYRQIYRRQRADLLQRRGEPVTDHPDSVATTISLSLQKVEEKNAAAVELLRLCAFLSPDAIVEEILRGGASSLGPTLAPVAADAFLLNQAIEALLAYSLVRRDPKGKTLSIHRLVQAVLQDELQEAERRTWAERAMCSVFVVFPKVHGTMPECEPLLPHALTVIQNTERYQIISQEAGILLYVTALYLHECGRYAESEPLYLRAARIFELQLPHSVTAPLQALAALYTERGKYPEAEALYRRVLHIEEQESGSESLVVVDRLQALATLSEKQGKYAEAEALYQRALSIWEKLGSREPSLESFVLERVAILYTAQGKFADAESCYLRALSLCEREGSEDGQTSVLHELANLYHNQNKYVEAEAFYHRALHILEQDLGSEHHEDRVASLLNDLALLYDKQGKYAEAEPLYLRALHIREQHLGPDQPKVASLLNSLADLYCQQGKYAEAEPLLQRALRIREQQFGPDQTEVAYPLNNLAALYYLQGKYAEAEPLHRRALHILEQVFGSEHPEVAPLLEVWAILYDNQGNYTEAEPLYQRALRIREQHFGPDQPEVVSLLNSLANLYADQNKYAEAEPLYQRALSIREQHFGPDQTEVAYPLHGLARLYREQGKYTEAEPLYQRALRIREQHFGPDHLEVAYPLHGLALLYHAQGKYTEAEPLYQRALRIWEQQFGPEHPDTVEITHDLARLWEAQGNSEEARSLYTRALAIREQALGAHHPKTTETRIRLIALLHALGQHEQVAKLEATQTQF